MVDDTSGEIVGVRVSGSCDGRNSSTSGSDRVGGEEEEKEAASSSEILTADHYVSAMSVDALKLHLPAAWKTMPFSNSSTNSPVCQSSTCTCGSIENSDRTMG